MIEGSGYDVIEGSAVEPAYNIQPRGSTSDIESELKQKVLVKLSYILLSFKFKSEELEWTNYIYTPT